MDGREGGREAVCGRGLVRAGVLHSYLHVEPCNYQASSAGAKLFFPHPGPCLWDPQSVDSRPMGGRNGRRGRQLANGRREMWRESLYTGVPALEHAAKLSLAC